MPFKIQKIKAWQRTFIIPGFDRNQTIHAVYFDLPNYLIKIFFKRFIYRNFIHADSSVGVVNTFCFLI